MAKERKKNAPQKKGAAKKGDKKKGEPEKKKGSGLIVKALIGGLLALSTVWLGMHSAAEGKGPWEWDEAAWGRFAKFAQEEAKKAQAEAEKVAEKAKKVDWKAVGKELGDEVAKRTKKLWNDLPQLEADLEKKLARLRANRERKRPEKDAPKKLRRVKRLKQSKSARPTKTAPGKTEPGKTEPKPEPARITRVEGEAPKAGMVEDDKDDERYEWVYEEVEEAEPEAPSEPTSYELGIESMRSAIGHYRKSLKSKAALKKAEKEFRTAFNHFEKALGEAEDDSSKQEIEGYIQTCQQHLYDCQKRKSL